MKTLAEAQKIANDRKKKNPKIPQFIMKNEYGYNVAYGEEDMKYGKELGYTVVEKV